jgi:hypothetical protein
MVSVPWTNFSFHSNEGGREGGDLCILCESCWFQWKKYFLHLGCVPHISLWVVSRFGHSLVSFLHAASYLLLSVVARWPESACLTDFRWSVRPFRSRFPFFRSGFSYQFSICHLAIGQIFLSHSDLFDRLGLWFLRALEFSPLAKIWKRLESHYYCFR